MEHPEPLLAGNGDVGNMRHFQTMKLSSDIINH